MSHVHIIAGPPGIGKSTRGSEFIDPELEILNKDEIRHRYRNKGYADYNEYSLQKVRSTVLQNLIKAKDFALELNLGFEHQYNYALSMKRFSNEVKLNVILFFTDHVQLCQDRAIQRFKKGLHLVKPDIIEQMYHNTIPLLKANFHAIDRLIMLDATEDNDVLLQGIYSKAAGQIKVFNKSADWFGNDVLPFIKEQLAIQRFDNPALKSWDKDDLGPPR